MEAFDRIPLISNLGFPIFVSWYLLTRVERKIDALATSITEMTQVIHG
nr:YvrJ family protein [Ammoniphilus resinae]